MRRERAERARRASRAMPRTPPTSWWRRRSPGSWWSPTSSPARPRSSPSRAQSSTPVPTPPAPGWHGPTGAACGWSSWTTPSPLACSSRTPTRRCAGGWPSSRPPRRWTGSAGSGGRRTARPSSPRGSTTRPSSAGGSRIRRIPTRSPRRSPTPPRAPRTPRSRPGSFGSTARARSWAGIATTSPTWRRPRGTTTGRSSPSIPGTSAASRCAGPTPRPVRPRRCGPTATRHGSSARRGRPRGWRTDAWSSARTRTIDDGSWWVARPSPPTTSTSATWPTSATTSSSSPPTRSTTPRAPRCGGGRTRASSS